MQLRGCGLASLQAELPAVEVHGRELLGRAPLHVDVQGLGLADVPCAQAAEFTGEDVAPVQSKEPRSRSRNYSNYRIPVTFDRVSEFHARLPGSADGPRSAAISMTFFCLISHTVL